jgi:hypothetical protein
MFDTHPNTRRTPTVWLFAALWLLLPISTLAEDGDAFAAAIGKAHGAQSWHGHNAFAAEIHLAFGGNTVIDGTLLTRTDTSGVRIEQKSGAVAVWDGQDAWVTPTADAFPGARFHVLTWPYFLAAGVKLQDPGTHLETLGKMTLHGEEYDTARLTFGDGVGDTPDDWYILYREPGSHRLKAMAYIVTYGTPQEKAEEEPHVIVYSDFVPVDGVAIAKSWAFYNWNEQDGAHGDPIGAVKITNPRFVTPPAGAFIRAEGAVVDALPGS